MSITMGRKCLPAVLLFCFCFGPFDPYDPAPPAGSGGGTEKPSSTGLLAHWTCDDSSGETLEDSSGRYHGTVNGCSRVGGLSGQALKFDGTDDFVVIANGDSAFDFGTGDFTFSIWVNPFMNRENSDSARYDIVSKGTAGKSGYALSIFRHRRFKAYFGQLKKESNDTTFFAKEEKWYHLVLLRNREAVELFVNGKRVESFDVSGIGFSSDSRLYFGRDAANRPENFYSGLVDEVKVFDFAWGTHQIMAEFERFGTVD